MISFSLLEFRVQVAREGSEVGKEGFGVMVGVDDGLLAHIPAAE